jgi:hypothetical protein
VEHEGDFRVEPVCILDRKFKVLGNKAIGIVNGHEHATWEHEENMWSEYLQIFDNFEENGTQDTISSS